MECTSLAAVRQQIDRIDRLLVGLLAERGGYVRQAARFKTDAAAVAAVWQTMIDAFIGAEQAAHAALHPPTPTPLTSD